MKAPETGNDLFEKRAREEGIEGWGRKGAPDGKMEDGVAQCCL